nr:hypothetical protein [Fredinandcohnia onubensis]
MAKQRVYYDYYEGQQVPFLYVLTFSAGEIKWDKHVFYFDIIAPFEYYDRDTFDDSIISASIFLGDLIVNVDSPNKLGINMKRVRQRIQGYGLDPYLVRQFIIMLPDIEDVLKLLPNRRTLSLLIE